MQKYWQNKSFLSITIIEVEYLGLRGKIIEE
jgi:hypothetical protein